MYSNREISDGEAIRIRANMVRGLRTLGGHLVATPTTILFQPHWFDRLTGGKVWQIRVADATRVGVADRGGNPLDGSWRRRLVIEVSNEEYLFVVPNAQRACSVIAELLIETNGQSDT